jgi:hypothetical protein
MRIFPATGSERLPVIMPMAFRERRRDDVEFGLIYGTIAVLALVAAYALPLVDLFPACLFKRMTSIPCPTCGATRSLVHLAHGEILKSFRMNPLFALTIIAALLGLIFNMLSLLGKFPRISITLTSSKAFLFRAAVMGAVLINWAYLIIIPDLK